MSSWNFGVVHTIVNDEHVFAVHEIYHGDDGDRSWTDEPVTFQSDTLDGLADMVLDALNDVRLALGATSDTRHGLVKHHLHRMYVDLTDDSDDEGDHGGQIER